MRWGVLGPLSVTDDAGTDIRVPAGRLQTLLAVLLMRANQPVPLDEIVELLWEGAPPAAAARTVRVYVARLRQVLGPGAGARVLTRSRGYLCQVGEDEFDLLRFETLCRQAGSAGRERSWSRAADLLSEALGLWRGAPLADVPSEPLRARECPRLDHLRQQAVEDTIDARMHLRQHQQLIPQLRELTADQPLREHLHAQLMRALARSGRRAEALAAYRNAQRALAGQLGIEPGPELRELHRRILAGDEEPDEGQVDRPGARPRQLPAPPGHFTGRHAELDTLVGLLASADRVTEPVVISAIDGMAGIGKTALAVHAAYQLTTKFPDGQLFIDLHGHTRGYPPREPGQALEALLRALDVPTARIPDDTEERAALYRQRLGGTRTLILLDNALDEAQVRPLLPGAPGCLVLVTSRRRLKGLDDAHSVSLDLLPPDDAVALLRAVAGPVHETDDALPGEVAQLCGRLPLALRIAGALLRHRPAWNLERLAALLRDQHRRVQALSDGERDLGAIFELSYAGLDAPHRLLLRRLALIPGPEADAYSAANLIDVEPATAEAMLERLVDHNLLGMPSPGRYRLHDLLRAYARSLAEQDPAVDSGAALDRLLDYYQHTANLAEVRIRQYHSRPAPGGAVPAHAPALPDARTAWAWLRTERPNLLAAVEHARTDGSTARLLALTTGLTTLLRTDGPWTFAAALHTAAATAAQRGGERDGRAAALTELATVLALRGEYAKAIRTLHEALELYGPTNHGHGRATALSVLGEVQRLAGDLQEAVRWQRKALGLYRELGDRRGEANALQRHGYANLFDGPSARHDLQRALNLYRELGEQRGQADVLIRLADLRQRTGDRAGAARDCEQALHLYRELGVRSGQATALSLLGTARAGTGDHSAAVRHLEEALRLHEALDDRYGQAHVLLALGGVRRRQGFHQDALAILARSLVLMRAIGARVNESSALVEYAVTLATMGDVTRARSAYGDALRLSREARVPDAEAKALEGLGECQLSTGQAEAGSTQLRQALEIYERLEMTGDRDRVRDRLVAVAPA